MTVSFAKGEWDKDLFEQITSLRTDGRKPFLQEEDCVVNDDVHDRQDHMTYNYISLLSRKWFRAPVRLETECSFERFGAPLLVLSDDIIQTEDGYPAYGHHFEIVAFEEGFNVWELNGRDKPILSGKGRFPVPAGSFFTLSAAIREGSADITLCGHTETVSLPALPARFRAGITACEGVNRFRSFRAAEER